MTSYEPRKQLTPDIIGDIRFFETDEGGRREPTASDRFGCPFRFEGELFDCVLLLDGIGPIYPGQRIKVPIKFLSPHLIKDMLAPGLDFQLWDMRVIAEGRIIEVIA
jgi:hypothetical protein